MNDNSISAARIIASALAEDGEVGSIAEALDSIARQLKYLGGGDASDNRGAIEVLAISVTEGTNRIADAIGRLADAVAERG